MARVVWGKTPEPALHDGRVKRGRCALCYKKNINKKSL
jgi:hypothetical protein